MPQILFGLTALLLPWFVTALWLRRLAPAGTPLDWPTALGYGYFVGLYLTVAILQTTDLAGLGLHAGLAITFWAIAALAWGISLGLGRLRGVQPRRLQLVPRDWGGWLVLVLAIVVAARLAGIALEIAWRPLAPWDAWTVWILRAEVWAEHARLVPFVDHETWIRSGGGDVYTVEAFFYPKTVSLIPTWVALVAGGWKDAVALAPWFGALLALLLGVYGQVRRFGGEPWEAMLLVYLLVSIPMIAVHTALAGYADLWVSATVGLSATALWYWQRSRQGFQLALALPLLLALPTLKVEGGVWLIPVVAGIVLARMRPPVLAMLAMGAVLLLLAWLWSGGIVLDVPRIGTVELTRDVVSVPGLISLGIGYTPQAWPALGKAMMLQGSWNLLWLGVMLALPFGLWRCRYDNDLRVPTYTLLAAVPMLVTLFLFTDASRWVIDLTSVNRLLLHFVPLVLFFAWLVARGILAPAPLSTMARTHPESDLIGKLSRPG
jgi:hypothetical protein